MANKKKIIYATIGVSLIGLAVFLFLRHKKKQKEEKKTDQQPVSKVTVITDNAPINKGTVTTGQNVTVKKEPIVATGKEVGINTVISQGPGAVIGRMLVAKYNGSGIYDTKYAKVSSTKQGNHLGMVISTAPASNGSYTLKYRDEKGNERIINSVAVNVIV